LRFELEVADGLLAEAEDKLRDKLRVLNVERVDTLTRSSQTCHMMLLTWIFFWCTVSNPNAPCNAVKPHLVLDVKDFHRFPMMRLRTSATPAPHARRPCLGWPSALSSRAPLPVALDWGCMPSQPRHPHHATNIPSCSQSCGGCTMMLGCHPSRSLSHGGCMTMLGRHPSPSLSCGGATTLGHHPPTLLRPAPASATTTGLSSTSPTRRHTGTWIMCAR
jgi:hypothetical protein